MNIEELKNPTGGETVPFVIERIIELPLEQYAEVCDDLLMDREFLKEAVDRMYVDSEGIWHILLIKAIGGIDGLGVQAEGYSYLRYCFYIPDYQTVLDASGSPTSEAQESPLTDKIVEQILCLRDEAKFNMFDITAIQREAYEKGFYELVLLLQDNRKSYIRFIMSGQR